MGMKPTKTCPVCARPFLPRPATQRTCSRSCAKTKVLPTKACEKCGVEFRKNPEYSYAVWDTIRFCSIACRGSGKPQRTLSCEQCGTDFPATRVVPAERFCCHPCYVQWLLDTAPLEPCANDTFSKRAKRLLIERADGKCEMCGTAGPLDIDHIVPRSAGGKGTVDNGQALCRPCHIQKTREDRQLMADLLRAHYATACPKRNKGSLQ